jgi:GNAT superfamily N-acetyltransferase
MDTVVVDNVTIRTAQPRDIQAVAQLWEALVEYHRELDSELPAATPTGALRYARRLEDQLQNPLAKVLIAEIEGRVVGYVFGMVVDLMPDMFRQEACGFLADIYVDERYRRHGVGRGLVQSLASWFRQQNLTYYEWHAAAQNPEALAFWRALGGREVMLRMRVDISSTDA